MCMYQLLSLVTAIWKKIVFIFFLKIFLKKKTLKGESLLIIFR